MILKMPTCRGDLMVMVFFDPVTATSTTSPYLGAAAESLQERSTVQLAYVCNVDPQIEHTSFDCNW